MKFLSVSTVALVALMVAPAAQAADNYSSITGAEMLKILNEVGYDGNLGTDNEGDPMITGSIQSMRYTLFFYRCNKQQNPEACLDLQFHYSQPNSSNVNYAAVNAYNRDNRFGQAFFQENGDVGLDMSATIQGGVSRQHIKEIIDWWKVTVTSFPTKLGNH